MNFKEILSFVSRDVTRGSKGMYARYYGSRPFSKTESKGNERLMPV